MAPGWWAGRTAEASAVPRLPWPSPGVDGSRRETVRRRIADLSLPRARPATVGSPALPPRPAAGPGAIDVTPCAGDPAAGFGGKCDGVVCRGGVAVAVAARGVLAALQQQRAERVPRAE